MRPLIRYGNRKLYDPAKRRYVRLVEVADLVAGGEDVRVTEHPTGRDVTALTMALIAVERAKEGRPLFGATQIAAALRATPRTAGR